MDYKDPKSVLERCEAAPDGLTKEITLFWVRRSVELEADNASLLKELEPLKQRVERYEQPNLKCGRGHENNLPLALWDCPMCTEEKRVELEQYKRALDEQMNVIYVQKDTQKNRLLRNAMKNIF